MLFTRKNILALSGLFLCVFLIVHLSANLILFLPTEIASIQYNAYSTLLRNNPLIGAISYVLYAAIVFHTIYAIIVTKKNREAKPVGYYVNNTAENSSWASQNMAPLGFLILIFIIVHMMNFWARIKLGIGAEVGMDSAGNVDVYSTVSELFKNPFYTFFYTVLMLPLGLHLNHGVNSAFKTLGLYHKKYLSWIAKGALVYSIAISVGFAVIPTVMYFR